jgi:hypothetical protein
MTTTTATTTQKSPTPLELARTLAFGAGVGVAAGLLLALASGLSPLSADDRRGLVLLGLTVALPLGCVAARKARHWRGALALAGSGVLCGVALATVVAAFEPALWWTCAVWFSGAALLGAAAAGLAGRGGAVVATGAWFALHSLPFCYHRVPWFTGTLEGWALQGAPWLGFSMDAFGGDPLRMPVLYMGKWSELSSGPAAGVLSPGTLWIAALLACATLAASVAPLRRKPKPRLENLPESV